MLSTISTYQNNFEQFKNKFLTELIKNSDTSIDIIEEYKIVIQNYSKEIENKNIKEFVKELNNIILQLRQYELVEKCLRHLVFSKILQEFRISDILIRACKEENIPTIQWLLTMELDFFVQDENGMTALMYSIKHSSLSFVVDSILQYLLEHGRTEIVKSLITDKQIDINHQDCQGNTLLSTVLKNYQEAYINCDRDAITTSISSLTMLIELGCDLNSSIDSDGNTPIMLFIMLKDYATTYYYLVKRYSDKIDLSVKNKNGINATYLTLFINTNSIQGRLLRDELVLHKTYDFSFVDRYNNNLIMHMIIREDTSSAINFLLKNKTCINHVNDRKENILILAIKFRCYGMLSNYLFNEININQQDNKGNTALHYAVQMKDKFSINTLCFYNANLHIKNNEGITPYDLAVALKDDSIINILTKQLLLI